MNNLDGNKQQAKQKEGIKKKQQSRRKTATDMAEEEDARLLM
jgi:hypothetical protein